MHSIKQTYVVPQYQKQGKVARETLGIATFSGEPFAGLHVSGEF